MSCIILSCTSCITVEHEQCHNNGMERRPDGSWGFRWKCALSGYKEWTVKVAIATYPASIFHYVLIRTIASTKGSVKKIRFAPGKGNTKILILYNNRVDVRDALEVGVAIIVVWFPSYSRRRYVGRSNGGVVRHV